MAPGSQVGQGNASSSKNPRPPPGADFSNQEPSNNNGEGPASKKKKHRAGKKRRNRRQSFAPPSEQGEAPEPGPQRPSLLDVPEGAATESQIYRAAGRDHSDTSLDSETLLDHRDQPTTRPRRLSALQSMHAQRSNQGHSHQGYSQHGGGFSASTGRDDSRDNYSFQQSRENDPTDRTPLISGRQQGSPFSKRPSGYGGMHGSPGSVLRPRSSNRRASASSSQSRRRKTMPTRQMSSHSMADDFDINNPPSVPGSPRLGGIDAFDEIMLPDQADFQQDIPAELKRRHPFLDSRDAIIDVDHPKHPHHEHHNSEINGPSPPGTNLQGNARRRAPQSPVEDVCLPFDQMTDIGEEEDSLQQEGSEKEGVKRSRKRPWPDISALEEWSREEKEERSIPGVRAKKVNEPEMVGGRFRPTKVSWQREDEEAPFRYTYFNEELESSLRSYNISGLQQLGLSFRELFIPDCPEIEDSSSDEEEEDDFRHTGTPLNGISRAGTRQSSILDAQAMSAKRAPSTSDTSGQNTPRKPQARDAKPKKHGPRPVFWLDVLQPTIDEMRVISRAFGIHKLTAEDIMEQEAREKVELFRNYYFVNYRTFEQDSESDEYLDPVNMYFVVFKGGVISFHFSQMPHPPNVRRRIRQLAEHQYTDSDWISYAIIDNITDAYAPLIEQIEKEVDDIDDDILRQQASSTRGTSSPYDSSSSSKTSRSNAYYKGRHGDYEKLPTEDPHTTNHNIPATSTNAQGDNIVNRDMLLRVGECRKKVMSLYRLLGNKADVIKGLAKRCNEQWTITPRSDVGLYLGDIQDHIVTMTSNLTHYENLLSRSHSNYLAQINIRMTERAEQTNDVLGKLTVLGTIVLPMNIITGMWGMNVLVPGQDGDTLYWFWGITAGLGVFGLTCFFIARKLYRVV